MRTGSTVSGIATFRRVEMAGFLFAIHAELADCVRDARKLACDFRELAEKLGKHSCNLRELAEQLSKHVCEFSEVA
jgi:hypothetical protein